MTEGLERIEEYFDAFREAIARSRSAAAFHTADWQDAYARLSRLRDRYLKEKGAPTQSGFSPARLDTVIVGDAVVTVPPIELSVAGVADALVVSATEKRVNADQRAGDDDGVAGKQPRGIARTIQQHVFADLIRRWVIGEVRFDL